MSNSLALALVLRPPSGWHSVLLLTFVAVLVIGCSPTVAPTPTVLTPTSASPTPTPRQPIAGGPLLLRDDITLRQVAATGTGNAKLARNPRDGELYYLDIRNGVYRIDLQGNKTRVITSTGVVTYGTASGMTFAPDGSLFILFNQNVGQNLTQAVIRKGVQGTSGGYAWETFARTEPYPLSATYYDHLYNGMVVSPDGKWVLVNAGSRTDHGEVEDNRRAFPNLREVALTSAILRIPADAHDRLLPADENALELYIFADGTRNAFDLEFAPNGDLFAVDNGPDADYPDELNWIRQGRHYGFPWRFGRQDNPQQFPDYSGYRDNRLQSGFSAIDNGTYRNDPNFPKPPPITFADPSANAGPDADQYRADDGSEHDASDEGKLEYTFTPHRSPLGLVFATDPKLPKDLRGDDQALSAFVLSYGAAGGTLSDKGQDLLHLRLTKNGDNYQAVTTQIARGFKNPVDAVMIENRLYVLEFGQGGALWELTFH